MKRAKMNLNTLRIQSFITSIDNSRLLKIVGQMNAYAGMDASEFDASTTDATSGNNTQSNNNCNYTANCSINCNPGNEQAN